MDAHPLITESVEILNRHIDEAMVVRGLAMRAHWVAQRSECLALPPVFERAGATLLGLADRLADRVIALDGTLEARGSLAANDSQALTATEHLRLLERMLLALVRATRRRCDIARAIGDSETANLLRQAWRGLELLLWQVGLFAYADE